MGNNVNLFISNTSKSTKSLHADDLALWRSLAKGNNLGFSSLYQRYANRLFNYGMHICYNRELVKDCIQELFTWIWNKRDELTDVNSVKYYLFKSFRNILVKAINKDRKFTEEPGENHFLEQSVSKEEELMQRELESFQKAKISSALSKITKRQREIVNLRFFNEMSYSEIAAIMGISIASAHNLLSKALQQLKEHI
ncbi:sigma-70 family RNA polymerase sigma factor [Algoriphagus halophytocola]|uniref:Sigma-70 family RNA polymerase sigma factor n=1 Tax=Algoriphagus halophytocola TaxID=2991499 RepID=A0ABY6MHE2_9BACT|nr:MULTISPECIES: sigma-70 family RNA polymerase sigma factor [unclassified Algoriphagus]UZD22618.1 sigma-70 family RNA polymerase sigma factor [Algoriphagus sp. TR-M5]WBL43884.1 sigma-70 family RNA polymerase sigma factor [Algoriphagus sp. TR-M9]